MPGLQCFLPACGAKAPEITGLQTRKTELGLGGGQVVATGTGELEELLTDDDTDSVDTDVTRTGVAAAVPEETGERIHAARLEFSTEDIASHDQTPLEG